jgi:hypothetical protein
LRMNSSIGSDHLTISSVSPENCLIMVLARMPFGPTHGPTGHTPGRDEWTATRHRCPRSLAMLFKDARARALPGALAQQFSALPCTDGFLSQPPGWLERGRQRFRVLLPPRVVLKSRCSLIRFVAD